MYQPRTYRHRIKDKDLVSFDVIVEETDLQIRVLKDLKNESLSLVRKYRNSLLKYIKEHPLFLTSLEPVSVRMDAPPIVKLMSEAAEKAGVGPMAAVAGAIAEFVGNELLNFSPEIIIENGGDIYLKSSKKRIIGVYAGESPLSDHIGLEIEGTETPVGICTSSGTVGHSLSFGTADAVVVVSQSAILADAVATAIGNLIKKQDDIQKGIEFARCIGGIKGLLIIKDDKIGIWGDIQICNLPSEKEER
jgi:ApbE superfamily uncharacterized protein (UPF0280 family)